MTVSNIRDKEIDMRNSGAAERLPGINIDTIINLRIDCLRRSWNPDASIDELDVIDVGHHASSMSHDGQPIFAKALTDVGRKRVYERVTDFACVFTWTFTITAQVKDVAGARVLPDLQQAEEYIADELRAILADAVRTINADNHVACHFAIIN
jgi:hypothetical protein